MPSSRAKSPEQRRERVRGSALWAAYGDALGFITELADASAVRRRAGGFPVEHTVPWKRRVGGRGGPTVPLPAGCLSDDTQLRLAVSRCIGPDGFDAEVFAKIELTVWPSYALGAGRSSRVAASHLLRRDASWSTNFFDTDRARYIDGGGNGAAMRVQPHVWASHDARAWYDVLTDVYVDAVITHGHPRGLLGAGFHALCLRHAIAHGAAPDPGEWRRALDALRASHDIIADHPELGGLWLGMWTERAGQELSTAVAETASELERDLDALESIPDQSLQGAYRSAVEALGAFRADQRGSATKTALLSAWLAWASAGDPDAALVIAANQLGTDTDSIATMAGALLGAGAAKEPSGAIADREYIEVEADRMWAASCGASIVTFPHPDLRYWQQPRTQADLLGTTNGDGQLAVAGLGPATLAGDQLSAKTGKTPASWSWVDLWFGQGVLIKRRARPPALPSSASVPPSDAYLAPALFPDSRQAPDGQRPEPTPVPAAGAAPRTIHELTDEAIAAGFDPYLLGRHLSRTRRGAVDVPSDARGIFRARSSPSRDAGTRRPGEARAYPATRYSLGA